MKSMLQKQEKHISVFSKHIDVLSNLLRLTKLNFPIIPLSEYKIGLNAPINNIYLSFHLMRKKAPIVEQTFLLTKNTRVLSEMTLIFFQKKIFNQILFKINLPLRSKFPCGCIYAHPHMSKADINLTYLVPHLES